MPPRTASRWCAIWPASWTSSSSSARPTAPTPTGRASSARVYPIDEAAALQPEWFAHVATVGLTAGASAPEYLVEGVIAGRRALDDIEVTTLDGVAEDVNFRLPAALADA